MKDIKILIVEGEDDLRSGLVECLSEYNVSNYKNADEALKVLKKGAFDLVIFDVWPVDQVNFIRKIDIEFVCLFQKMKNK